MVFISMLSTATGQTISDTFDTADIPTNLGTYSSTCNGPLTMLSVTLPPGDPWQLTSIDIEYEMTVRLDEGGNILWQKLLGGASSDYAACLDITNDGGAVIVDTHNRQIQEL